MTEKTMNIAIKKIAENCNQIEQSLVKQLRLEVPNHYLTVGTYRERVWKSLFEMIIPKKYCIEQSVFIIDSYGNISREVDLAVYDEMYTPYIFNYGEIKFIPIEAVTVVVQCKSGINDTATAENVKEWVGCIEALMTSMDSVTRTFSDLVVNYDQSLQSKNLTQTSTRPIKILCATEMGRSMRTKLLKEFDILLFVEDIGTGKDGEKKSKLVKQIPGEEQNFIQWNDDLNHFMHKDREKKEREYMEGRKKEALSSTVSLQSRNLTQLRVTNNQEEENTILSLTFQLNQLLMFLNNPMLFPHRAYARMFTKNLGGKIQED